MLRGAGFQPAKMPQEEMKEVCYNFEGKQKQYYLEKFNNSPLHLPTSQKFYEDLNNILWEAYKNEQPNKIKPLLLVNKGPIDM